MKSFLKAYGNFEGVLGWIHVPVVVDVRGAVVVKEARDDGVVAHRGVERETDGDVFLFEALGAVVGKQVEPKLVPFLGVVNRDGASLRVSRWFSLANIQ